MANDGVWVAPRIVAATTEPQNTPQTIAFHPVEQRRVLSSFTAAEMRQMMQGVVLHGTGTRALLEGYSSAGKTGTAQKVDPATHAYSHTKYVASFGGFAPINDPAVTVAVILDSAVGLHQGGQVSAPVFHRIAQQVLEYLHTPHDVELPRSQQVLLASRKVEDKDLVEGSPDRLGEALDLPDAPANNTVQQAANTPPPASSGPAIAVVSASLREPLPAVLPEPSQVALSSSPPAPIHSQSSGTVVLDVDQGGIVVPSFLGKSVRAAIETAEESGLDLDAVGSGIARDQSPPAGSRVASGSKVTVKFGR
jgi:cell division protein FtsI (penicillin-binding protein 3)